MRSKHSGTLDITRGKASLDLALPITLANRGGANSDGALVGLTTHTAVTDCTSEDNSAGTFVDELADANSAAAGDVLLTQPFDTDDALYISYSARFYGVVINVATAGAGDAVGAETLMEYYDGAAWVTLEGASQHFVDDSTDLTAGTATYVITFVPPSDWAEVSVDGGPTDYAIRFKATADDVYNTTDPTITQIWVLPLDVGVGPKAMFGGKVTEVECFARTASATNADTELLVVNYTRGTGCHVTWTQADTFDRVSSITEFNGGDFLVHPGDELGLHCIVEDGTTEFADGGVRLILE